MEKCIELVKLDYSHLVISNAGGDLSAHYPSQLIILEYEYTHSQNGSPANTSQNPSGHGQRTTNTIYESMYDAQKLRDIISKSRFARFAFLKSIAL